MGVPGPGFPGAGCVDRHVCRLAPLEDHNLLFTNNPVGHATRNRCLLLHIADHLVRVLATLFGILLGVPLAYLLARHEFRGKRFFEALIDVPIVIPHSAAGIALLFVFGRQFFLGKVFGSLGVTFVDAVAGIVICMMFVSVPFLIDSARDGFKTVDVRLEKVARSLGASPWRVFFRVSLPLAWRSIFSGSVMMWARAISEFGAIMIFAYHVPFLGEHPTVAPILVYERFANYGLSSAAPVAILVILVSLVAFVVLRMLAFRGRKA